MKQEEMNLLIPEKLKEIERVFNVEILWAVESGSRAWGFASPDSDFDVRFIYKRPLNEYLHLNTSRDVIELPVDDTWDVTGWDLDKTLKLLNSSNPTLYEWFNSPIKYWDTEFRSKIEPLLHICFSEKRMLNHYLNTARKQISRYFQDETVKPKKYFYAIRPILACEWILKYHAAPPVPFQVLVEDVLPESMKEYVYRLLTIKMTAPEDFRIHQIDEVNAFLREEMEKIDIYISSKNEPVGNNWSSLNDFFIEEVSLVKNSITR